MKHRLHIFSLLICIQCFNAKFVQAQICTGSLGDPVVNITFGKGYTAASSYVPTDSYTFLPGNDCPNDGFYTITSATTNCYGGTWHNVTNDHTGGGNFMLVNASYDPGDFFVTTVTNLCPNTTYEFSAWVMNVMKVFNSILPDILFTIEQPDGTILSSYESGKISATSSPEWNKYGFLFTTPANNATIVLRLRNNSPGGYGNDLALDDIAFRPCGPLVKASIDNNATDTVDICEGNSNQYTFSGNASSVYQSPVYQWQESKDTGTIWQDIPGATNNAYLRLSTPTAGKYWYRFTVVDADVAGITSCRIASNLLIINVHPLPVANAGPDRTYIKGYPVTIDAIASGENVSYTWQPTSYMNNAASITPTVSPPTDISYQLSVKSAFNCSSIDNVSIKVVDGLFIPNAFTPNGDGKNDVWHIPSLDVGLKADVKIYSRWGLLVYHASSSEVSWNGTINSIPQPSGVYHYIINFKDKTLPPVKGTIMLIR